LYWNVNVEIWSGLIIRSGCWLNEVGHTNTRFLPPVESSLIWNVTCHPATGEPLVVEELTSPATVIDRTSFPVNGYTGVAE
jgi:hypothetical protein